MTDADGAMNDPGTAMDFRRQDWHAMPADAIAAELASDPLRGLSATEAQRRLAIHGPNELAQTAATSALTIFARQFTSLVIWILILAASVSAVMGERVDAIAIVAIVVLNAVIGFFQEYRAEKAVAELKRMTAPRGRVLRDGSATTVPASVLIPATCCWCRRAIPWPPTRASRETGLETNEAALTGESVRWENRSPFARATRCCRSATTCCSSAPRSRGAAAARWSGPLECAPSSGTSPGCSKPPRRADSAPAPVGPGRPAAALVLSGDRRAHLRAGADSRGPDFRDVLGAISLPGATIPEGLPAIVTVALALGNSRIRRHALIRRLHSVETLGRAQVICTDKTGTLTLGEMTWHKVMTSDHVFDVTGEGYSTDGAIFIDGEALAGQDAALDDLLLAAVACNDSHLASQAGRPAVVGDPRGRAARARRETGMAASRSPRRSAGSQRSRSRPSTSG